MTADPEWRIDLRRIEHEGKKPQQDFYLSESFEKLYYGGVGIGKSVVMLADFCTFAEKYPGSIQILTEPTYPMIRDILIPILERTGWEGSKCAIKRQPPPEVHWHNGAQIWLRSTDVNPERNYGPTVARVGMDEITLGHQEEARNILMQRARDTRFPNQMLYTGTPKGRNWAYKALVEKAHPDISVHFAETQDAERAGLLPEGYVERLLRSYGGWDNPLARQELAGQFLAMAGQVFPQFAREKHIRNPDGDPALLFKERLGGIDPGGVNPSALVVAGRDNGGRIWGYGEWYKHEATEDELVAAMAELQETHKVTRWIIDPAAKAVRIKLSNAGFRVSAAQHGNDLKLRVRLMGARLTVQPGGPGLYVASWMPNTITEFETLMWRRVRLAQGTEMLNDAFERGCPDHAIDAFTNILAEWDEAFTLPAKRPQTRQYALTARR